MPTLAEVFDVVDKFDRVCLILPDLKEDEPGLKPHSVCVIASVLEVTDDKIVVGDGGDFFTTTFSWQGLPIDDGRLKTKRIPPSELERIDEYRIQGLYPTGRIPTKKYPPKPRAKE